MYREGKDFGENGFDWDEALIPDGDEAHVVFAVFNDGKFARSDMLDIFNFFASKSFKKGKAYLSVEGLGNQPDFCAGDIGLYAGMGVRMMSLTWNGDNPLAGGIGKNSSALSPLGREVVELMNKHPVLADISHASDYASREIIELSALPVCASHSNSRTVYGAARNISDDLIRLVAKSGGVVGVNLYPDFVSSGACSVDDIVRHIDHIACVGGEKSVGIGSDFDGIDKKIKGLEDCGCFHRLYDALLTKRYSETFINGLFFNNFGELFKKYE